MQLGSRMNRYEEWADVDFSHQTFDSFGADGGTFLRCDFSEASFQSFSVGHDTQTRFVECVFRRTRFPLNNTYFRDSRFERCVFDGARLRDLRLDNTEFIDCVFRGRIWHTIFFGSPSRWGGDAEPRRLANEWRGNDFTQADLVDVDFRDIDLAAQRWPTGVDEYALLDRIDQRAAAAIATMSDLPDRLRHTPETLRDHSHPDPHGLVLVARRELGRRVPPQWRDRLWAELITDYNDDHM